MTAGTIDIPASRGRGRPKTLTEAQARRLTDEIKTRTVELWLLVEQAHVGKAWAALGYDSWKSYSQHELNISESRSFQLLDQAKVMRALASEGVDMAAIETPPARVVQLVKGSLPALRKVARDAMRDGVDVNDAIREYAKTKRPTVVEHEPEAPATAAATVPCPACEGHGKLPSQRMANRIIKALGLSR